MLFNEVKPYERKKKMTLNIIRLYKERKQREKTMRLFEIQEERQKAVYEFMDLLSEKGYDFVHLRP